MTKQKYLFYIFLIILVVERIIKILNTVEVIDMVETHSLFISSCMSGGVMPNPLIFQQNIVWAGGGHFIYGLASVPFILLFGKSYFSVRLASIVFLILTYALTYKFCNKYFGLRTAIFASLLFIITPELTTMRSIIAEGRHFQLNLFFILSLYLFSKIKETKKILYYLLFGLACAMGVYFYPAFLVSVFIFGLFLFLDTDLKNLTFIYKYLILVILIIIAVNFLRFDHTWFSNFYELINGMVPKNLHPGGSLFSVLTQFVVNLFWNMPNVLVLSLGVREGASAASFYNSLSSLWLNITTLSRIRFELIRFTFIASFISLTWLNRMYLNEIIFNGPFFSLKRKEKRGVPISKYITVFLLVHVFVYILLYSFNEKGLDNHGLTKYFLPLFLNIILILAVFLNELWQRNKYLSLSLLLLILSPGIIFQFNSLKTIHTKDFYKHYIYFYDRDNNSIHEIMSDKPILVHRLISDKFNINSCYTLGELYFGLSYKYIDAVFSYLSRGNPKKLSYLYQGLAKAVFIKSNGNIKQALEEIENISAECRNYCYIGLGETMLANKLVLLGLNNSGSDEESDKKNIEEAIILIKDNYKKYFYQGLGGGLARRFAVAYSPYFIDKSYDKILVSYLNMIGNKEYKDAFLVGFFNKDIWSKF